MRQASLSREIKSCESLSCPMKADLDCVGLSSHGVAIGAEGRLNRRDWHFDGRLVLLCHEIIPIWWG